MEGRWETVGCNLGGLRYNSMQTVVGPSSESVIRQREADG